MDKVPKNVVPSTIIPEYLSPLLGKCVMCISVPAQVLAMIINGELTQSVVNEHLSAVALHGTENRIVSQLALKVATVLSAVLPSTRYSHLRIVGSHMASLGGNVLNSTFQKLCLVYYFV